MNGVEENKTMDVEEVPFTKEEILAEINFRLKMQNKNTIYVSKLPKNLTRRDLAVLIPEMLSCRFPISSNNKNLSYCFVRFKDEETMKNNLNLLNGKTFCGKTLEAQLPKEYVPYKSLEYFDMKSLIFYCAKPETQKKHVIDVITNADIEFPQYSDKSSKGHCLLKFKTEEEALKFFSLKSIILKKEKVTVNFVLKEKSEIRKNNEKEIEKVNEIQNNKLKRKRNSSIESDKVINPTNKKIKTLESEKLPVKKEEIKRKQNQKIKRKLDESDDKVECPLKKSKLQESDVAPVDSKEKQAVPVKIVAKEKQLAPVKVVAKGKQTAPAKVIVKGKQTAPAKVIVKEKQPLQNNIKKETKKDFPAKSNNKSNKRKSK